MTHAVRKFFVCHAPCTACIVWGFLVLTHVPGSVVFAANGTSGPDVQGLRERLTEREDENRVEEPFVLDIYGRPLAVNGQYEISLDYLERPLLGAPTIPHSQLLLEQELELEAFYPLHETMSLFVQVRLVQEEELDSATLDDVSEIRGERGEMWLFLEDVAGLPLSVEIGRLDFEDDRLWWWDTDLDAIRAVFETDAMEVSLAVAEEIASTRSDRGSIDAEEDDVVRLIAEVSWDWSEEQAIELFWISQDDQSGRMPSADGRSPDDQDESDADLSWIGLRVSGAVEFEANGLLGYWVDSAWVEGDERLEVHENGADAEDASSSDPHAMEKSLVQDVRGWGVDIGATFLLQQPGEPRITLAYARGSGDGNTENNIDRAFRQTGLQGNSPGFGGVERFQGYGEVLDPDLSNISIITVGVGRSLFKASSIDLVYHEYQLLERADGLRRSRIDAELTGEHRDVGEGFDLILGLEEWDTLQFVISAAAFRAGRAFGADGGEWVLGAFGAAKLAF